MVEGRGHQQMGAAVDRQPALVRLVDALERSERILEVRRGSGDVRVRRRRRGQLAELRPDDG